LIFWAVIWDRTSTIPDRGRERKPVTESGYVFVSCGRVRRKALREK
jgi:hypothetical protein